MLETCEVCMLETCEVCGVCGLTAPADGHPCRFETACLCWYGEDCEAAILAATVEGMAVQQQAV